MVDIEISPWLFSCPIAREDQARRETVQRFLWHAAIIITLGILQIGPGIAFAVSRVDVTARDVMGGSKMFDQRDGADGDHIVATARQNTLPGHGIGLATVEAKATEGRLSVHTFATAEATSAIGQRSARTDAEANALWRDSFVITRNDGDIHPFTIEAKVFLIGSMVANATGSEGHSEPWANSRINVSGTGIKNQWDTSGQLAYFPANPENNINDSIPQVYNITLLGISGQPTFLTYQIATTTIATAVVDGPGSFSASANGATSYEYALAWGGITRVLNMAGNEIKDYSISSKSGFDYTVSAVPEPLPVVMLLLGLALIAIIRNPLGKAYRKLSTTT